MTTGTYSITVTRQSANDFAQQAYIKASNTGSGDQYGYSIALSGDTLAVGAYREDSNATGIDGDAGDDSLADAGAVYVFVRNGTAWSQQAYIKASNTDSGDRFGISLALSGDTLAVGAYREDGNATGVDGVASDNSLRTAGRSMCTPAAARYGASRLISRLPIPGVTTPSVGASPCPAIRSPWGLPGRPASRSASTATRTTTVWPRLVPSMCTPATARRGPSKPISRHPIPAVTTTSAIPSLSPATRSLSGPIGKPSNATGIDGDQDDDSLVNAGAVYVFSRNGAAWSQQTYIKASNTGSDDVFGWSLALCGDTLAVGAAGEASSASGIDGNQNDDSAPFTGAVYVFTRSGAAWSQQAYLKASNSGSDDVFGWSLALTGDTLAVGAPREDSKASGIDGDESDNSLSDSGAVYLFSRSAAVWSQTAYVKASSTDTEIFSDIVSLSPMTRWPRERRGRTAAPPASTATRSTTAKAAPAPPTPSGKQPSGTVFPDRMARPAFPCTLRPCILPGFVPAGSDSVGNVPLAVTQAVVRYSRA